MSLVEHIIEEILEITQEEINIIHEEIHRITERDKEGLEGEEREEQNEKCRGVGTI